MLRAMTRPRPWLLLAFVAACGGASPDPDGGPEATDAGEDAAVGRDGGMRDGFVSVDAFTPDAGSQDAGLLEPSVTLGTGQLDFEPLPSDGTLELTRGGQGGVHLDVGARIFAVEPDRLVLRYFGYQAESGLRIFLPTARSLDPDDVIDEGDSVVRPGDRLVLDETRVDQVAIVGMQIRIEVVVEAPDGALTDSAIITVVDEI